MTRVVIVPGIGGSGDAHWQTRWEASIEGAVRIRPSSWDEPALEDWLAAIGAAVADAPADEVVFVAHSMGSIAVAEWLRRHPAGAAGAFLVAPPDPDGPAYPDEAREFAGLPVASLGVPALVVASSDDPFGSAAHAERLAHGWNAGIVDVGPHGHLNAASGLGAWEDGARLLEEFTAGLACARVPVRR